MTTNNIQIITAIERGGLNVRILTIPCKILDPDPNFDLKEAIKQAIQQYLHTPNGKTTYLYNNKCFNWADFVTNVPNEINRQYGFETIGSTSLLSDIIVDWDEHLADDAELQDFWGNTLDTK